MSKFEKYDIIIFIRGYRIDKKERKMKKIALFAGVFGALFVVAGANADIKTASTNVVRKSVYDITYGDGTVDTSTSSSTYDYGYRRGTVPQTAKLASVEGAAINNVITDVDDTPTITGVAVGSLAATASTNISTSSIKNNKANVAVLQRDKLSTAYAGNCGSSDECGYVTIGNHSNQPATASSDNGRTWMKIATAADAQ